MAANIIESTKRLTHGQLTATIAHEISPFWEKRGYYVLLDHDRSGGKIVSFFGSENPNRSTQLSHIDIAIVKKTSADIDSVFALIEIEETTDKPKVLLGDALGILMGEHISTKNKKPVEVSENTLCVILAKSSVVHRKRNKYLIDRVTATKNYLATPHSAIEKVFIKALYNKKRTVKLLTNVLYKAYG
jgi:hypothetical protein